VGLVFCGGAVVFFGAFYLLLGQSRKKRSSPTGINLVAFCVGGALSTFAALPIRAPAGVRLCRPCRSAGLWLPMPQAEIRPGRPCHRKVLKSSAGSSVLHALSGR
jgi:hypothetical protein